MSAESYSFPCDVYSFGLLLWELAHAEKVFASLDGREVSRILRLGGRPQLQLPPSLKAFGPLITSCWCRDPAQRPTMSACADELFELVAAGVSDPLSVEECMPRSANTAAAPAAASDAAEQLSGAAPSQGCADQYDRNTYTAKAGNMFEPALSATEKPPEPTREPSEFRPSQQNAGGGAVIDGVG